VAKKRPAIPRATSERVLNEYRHKCAICGRERPHLHHLDEDSTNNDPLNLLPLCPNCHLQDVHDPTQRPDPEKLQLFRRYKDPLILDPRFHPIFRRLVLLQHAIRSGIEIQYHAQDLLDFISEFEMGRFYKQKIRTHIGHQARFYNYHLYLQGAPIGSDEEVSNDPTLKHKAQEHCTQQIEELVIELLRYQEWVAKPFKADS
jgi:hypothetical protein